ncbi:cellulase family glycosylhydrolase [Rapidithrix thailandica]|uniref:mannan endo-1,4-beta-mannosidase n=1 Tax=Rapidithrix thailandica TaxID=413964 RepID=A0AAW9S2R6_9BACT
MAEFEKNFIKVKGTQFERNGQPYRFVGVNFWNAMNLASQGPRGDRERLLRELDLLQSYGVNNIRIMCGTEGPDSEPYRIVPALQTAPGVYNEDLLDGLDFLLAQLHRREMHTVMCLNNFWQWSGGMAQYRVWANPEKNIPYPDIETGENFDAYENFTAGFYSDPQAVNYFNEHIEFIIGRTNGYSGIDYKEDPAIMAWELGNEPRGTNNMTDFYQWLNTTSSLIKSLAPHQLLTVGSEGTMEGITGTEFLKDHSFEAIDYTTVHVWIENRNWYDPANAQATYLQAVDTAAEVLKEHVQWALKLNKPLVLEEFGVARDEGKYDPSASVKYRNDFYGRMFEAVLQSVKMGDPLVGANIWAWGGEGRPEAPKCVWNTGNDFTGDPPHEYQGWYSVYEKDQATLALIKQYNKALEKWG